MDDGKQIHRLTLSQPKTTEISLSYENTLFVNELSSITTK